MTVSGRFLRSILLCCVGLGSLVGCADSGSEGDDAATSAETTSAPNDFPTLQAEVDAAAACSTAGAVSLQLVATRIDCIHGPPCTLPNPPRETEGTLIACPSDDDAAIMQVAVEMTGKYYVETVLVKDDTSEVRECWSNRPQPEVLIDDPELQARPTIPVTSLGGPCPPLD